MAFLFENLVAYQKALDVAKKITSFVQGFSTENPVLTDQLRRASMSIPANIAEGCGRWHARDKIQFFRIALGSTNECIPFLELAASLKLLGAQDLQRLRQDLEITGKLISGLIKSTSSKTHN